MALVLADRVRETTTTTGTGSVTLAGAYTGFQTFSAGVGNGNSTYYTIANVASGEWEVGIGSYASGGNLLSRTTVLASSNGGSLVNFGAGVKDAFVTQPAERALYVASAGTGLESKVTAFTNGGIVYASSTSALATGSALVFDGTNLGVGVTPSAWGGGSKPIQSVNASFWGLAGTASFSSVGANYFYDGFYKYISAGVATDYYQYLGAHIWRTAASGAAGGTISFTQAMTLDSSGNLGIGTSSPAYKLEVATGTEASGQVAVANFRTASTTASYNAGIQIYATASATAGSRAVSAIWDADGANSGGGDYFIAAKNGNNGTIDFLQYSNASMRFATNYVSRASIDMTLDASGRLVIGDTTATQKLTVVSTSGTYGTAYQPIMQIGNTSSGGTVGNPTGLGAIVWSTDGTATPVASIEAVRENPGAGAASALYFRTGSSGGGTTRAVIDSSGNLGLGVTPSAWGSITKNIEGGSGSLNFYSTSQLWLTQNAVWNSGWTYKTTDAATSFQQYQGGYYWYQAASGTAGNAITFTQAMTLDASGRLGIGTSSPTQRLEVKTATDKITQFLSGSGAAVQWQTINDAKTANVPLVISALQTSFFTGGSERLVIDSSGNLLVGTTSANGSAKCGVTQTSTNSGFYVQYLNHDASTGDNSFIGFGTEAAVNTRGSITYNRGAGLVAYNVTSDYRAKDIIGPVTDSGELIDSVPVYMGKMKGATQERPMFIAHETPNYAHTGEKDAVDADGKPVYQQMDASALIPVMWAEIQSLRKRLAAANL